MDDTPAMDVFIFYLIVWSVVSLSNLAIGHGSLKIGNFLRPYGGVVRKFGWAFTVYGMFSVVTVIAALLRYYAQGINPSYQGIGYVAWVRTAVATLFWPAVAIAVEIMAYKITHIEPATRATMIEFHRSVFKLKKVVEERRA